MLKNKIYQLNKNKIKILIVPSFLGVFIFYFLPVVMSPIDAFSDAKSPFINFKNILTNEAFKLAAFNSIKFTLIAVLLLITFSSLFSLFVFRSENLAANVLKTISLIPFAVPVSTLVIVWQSLFSRQGILNSYLLGLGILPHDWLNSKYAFLILVSTYIWKNLGYTSIIIIAGLNGIPKSQYEAAIVDGATSFKQFIYITLPNLKNQLLFLIILSIMNSLKVFREIYLIGGDYPHRSIYMLPNLLNNWFRDLNLLNISVASVLIILVLSLILVFLLNFMDIGE